MKSKFSYKKKCLLVCDIVCIVLGLLFFYQIITKKNELVKSEMNEAESWYEATETVYQIRQYIDSSSAQIYAENESSEYIDRYFRVEKEELQVILNDYDIQEELEAFPITIQESEMLLPIGEKMWLKYEAGGESNLPLGLFIQNLTADIGHLPYEDDNYRYYYISDDSMDNPAILYIEPIDNK